jgi:hypothetical protein
MAGKKGFPSIMEQLNGIRTQRNPDAESLMDDFKIKPAPVTTTAKTEVTTAPSSKSTTGTIGETPTVEHKTTAPLPTPPAAPGPIIKTESSAIESKEKKPPAIVEEKSIPQVWSDQNRKLSASNFNGRNRPKLTITFPPQIVEDIQRRAQAEDKTFSRVLQEAYMHAMNCSKSGFCSGGH